MGLWELNYFCLVLKVLVFSCFLVLQEGYADFSVSGISQSSSIVPALPPIGEEIIGDVSLSPSLTNGTILNSPIASQPPISTPGPETSKGFTPNPHSNGPTSTPPNNSDHPPSASSGSVPVSSPSNNPYQKPRYLGHPIFITEAPVPVGLPSYQSPPSPPASNPLIPLLEPPSADQNSPPVPMSPAVNESPPRIIPLPSPPEPIVPTPSKSEDTFPPPEPTLPTEPPSNSSGDIAPTPRKSEDTFPPPRPTFPTEPPPNSSGDIAPTPSKSEETFPPPQPTLPTEPPNNSSGDIAPTPSKSEETFPPPQPTLPTEPPPNASGDIAPTPSKSEETSPPPQPTLPTEPPPNASGDIAPTPSKETFPPPQPTFPTEPPPNASGDIAPTPRKSEGTFPPPQPTLPAEPPPNSSGDMAPTPRKSEDTFPPPQPTLPAEPPPNSSGDMAPTPRKSEDTFPPPQPTLPAEPPPNRSGDKRERNSPPVPSPNPVTIPGRAGKPVAAPPYGTDGHHLPVNPSSPTLAPDRRRNPGRAAKPVAVPLNGTSNLHPSISPLPTNVPSSHEGKGNISRAPPSSLYPNSSPNPKLKPPESVPSTSAQSPRSSPKPNDEIAAPASPVKDVPRHASPKQEPEHPRTNIGLNASPPWKSVEGDESPVPSSVSISPPQRTKVPRPQSTTMFPKMPFQALPPPPPNEDCATLTCSEPLTNSPSGCRCVLPIQVGLRLGVALYTFFPLVSELAAEISAGDFLEQSQVRIMGANEASQDPEKTIVLSDLVPLEEKFDNITANLIFQRFWHKQVYIKNSLFGSYEVLYVRYPGLPPSPPSATPDIDVIANDPYHNHQNSSRTTKPLGVDVSKIKHSTGPNKGVIAIIVLSASLAVIVFCAVLWVLIFKDRGSLCHPQKTPPTPVSSLAKSSGRPASVTASGPGSASMSLGSSMAAYTGSMKTFSSHEIESATDNFNENRILGEGGFGLVYRGVLGDGTQVAVKVLKRDDHQSGREFLAEVEMLSRLHHRNLVKLIGICIEEHSRCLVYELVPSGSVESRLHGVDEGTAPLDWTARLKIALGAARGLAYLHEDSSPRVIHRDFKASNILLEHDYTPKVSDFGLARAALEDNQHISTRVMGTFGYVAPEYAMTGHLLVKSDVYSYGVVLLELLTGKKPIDMSQQPGQENLVSWVRPLLTSKESLELIIDQSLGPNFPLDSIVKVAAIASMCVQPEVENRPFMGEVVQALKLVCNECEEIRGHGSRSCSREDISVDMDASSECEVDPHCFGSCDSRHDVERGFSVSELLSSSERSDRIELESLRRHSSSGPLQTTNTRWPWQNMRRSSEGGSISEHHMMYKLWPRNR